MFKRKTIVIAVALAFVVQSAGASDAGMQKLFDDIGAYGNVSAPGAYHAQGMGVISGGSIFMRTPPGKNQSLVNVSLPSLKMGCGGIDLFGGSFSFLSKDKLIALFKNIGSHAAAYAFKLALDSISPQINKTLTELEQRLAELNKLNINSCEAGEALARGATGDWQKSSEYFAKVTGPITGLFEDPSQARDQTQGNDTAVSSTNAAVTDPVMKRMVKPGNIVWRALSSDASLDTVDKELLMSMTGTAILLTDSQTKPDYYAPKAITIHQFIRGNENGKIPIYVCDTTIEDGCLAMSSGETTVTPYAQKVEAKLTRIADKFKDNEKLDATDIAFINVTSLPIYKALAVTTGVPNAGLDINWIGKYSDLIAAEYAFQFIVQASEQLQKAFSQSMQSSPGVAQSDFQRMQTQLDKAKNDAREEIRLAYNKVDSVNKVVDEIMYMERALIGNLPSNLAGNMRFASAGK